MREEPAAADGSVTVPMLAKSHLYNVINQKFLVSGLNGCYHKQCVFPTACSIGD
jgi:hypothetical protein